MCHVEHVKNGRDSPQSVRVCYSNPVELKSFEGLGQSVQKLLPPNL